MRRRWQPNMSTPDVAMSMRKCNGLQNFRWASSGRLQNGASVRRIDGVTRLRHGRDSQARLDGVRNTERFRYRGAETGDVAHFPPASRILLAIQMQLGLRMCEHGMPVRLALVRRLIVAVPDVAQQIDHDGRPVLTGIAKGKICKDPQLLLELRGHARVDGVMAAVVRSRGNFVH